MNEITNHAELTVEKKLEGDYKKARRLMWAAYIVIPVAFIILFSILKMTFFALIIVPVYPFLLSKVIIPATYIYVDREEKMSIAGGMLTLSTIYGKRKQKILVKMRISSFDAIVPYNDEYKAQCDAFEADKRYEAVSTMSNPEIYCAYGTNDYEEKIICFFEVTNKALRVMKFLNKNTVVTQVSR
ncbi:MAG: hypothetical protein E7652_00880 [Ruminococcaceae bacterium]|nr:hypothetical protein [Oscillospiraceae bacterium]